MEDNLSDKTKLFLASHDMSLIFKVTIMTISDNYVNIKHGGILVYYVQMSKAAIFIQMTDRAKWYM